MKFTIFMKYWSLVWLFFSIGCALGCVLKKDYLGAMLCVVCCAINHCCYNFHSRILTNNSKNNKTR